MNKQKSTHHFIEFTSPVDLKSIRKVYKDTSITDLTTLDGNNDLVKCFRSFSSNILAVSESRKRKATPVGKVAVDYPRP